MINSARFYVVAAAIFLMSACSPSGNPSDIDGADVVSKSFGSESLTAPDISEDGVELSGALVKLPFKFERAYDRFANVGGLAERQLGLLVAGDDYRIYASQLDLSLKASGFQTRVRENNDGWIWISLTNASGHKSKVVVRPDAARGGSLVVFKLPMD